MRKIRIIGILTHFKLKKDHEGKEVCIVGGVDFARVVQPLSYLPKDKFEVDVQYEAVGKNSRFKTLEELTKYYDICYFSYIDSVPFYIQLKVLGMKNNMKMITDLDDNIWQVHPSHPNYKDFELGSEGNFKRGAILLDVDKVTTTNSFLRYKIVEYIKRPIQDIAIMPNFVDLTKYDFKKIAPSPKSKELIIGYQGGSSHYPDINKPEFTKALGIIMNKYPQVRFKTTFYMPQLKALFGYKYQYTLGRHNVYRFIDEVWTDMMSECSIFVAPLSYGHYNRSRSYIKYLEYSAGKRPSVMEKIDPYESVLVNAEERGFLANRTDEWVKHLSFLIEHPEAGKEIGENAYNYVKEKHTIQKNVGIYADYFHSLVDKPKNK